MELQKEQIEKRDFFRITELLKLSYRIITPEELNSLNFRFDIAAISDERSRDLLLVLDNLNSETTMLIERLAKDHELLAQYLKLLERKILLLTKMLYQQHASVFLKVPANLSEGGIAFGCNEYLAPEILIRISMALLPFADEIIVYGQVLRIDVVADNKVFCEIDLASLQAFKYLVAVKFTHLENTDKQTLAKYILHKQRA